jgi:hypothetical protein
VNSFQFGKDKFDSVCLFVCLFVYDMGSTGRIRYVNM